MTPALLVALASLMLAIAGALVGSVIFLVKVSLKIGSVLTKIEGLEEKYEEREAKNEATDRAVSSFELMKEGYSALKSRLDKHDSHITELRVNTGIMRRTGGEVG